MKHRKTVVGLIVMMVMLVGCASASRHESAAPSADLPSTSDTDSDEGAVDVTSNNDATSNNQDKADLATNFVLTTLSGEELSLEELRGRYVLVNFWATWCVPCRKEMPYLQAISEEHSDQLVVLGVNMREEAERVQPFIDEMALTFPILLEPTNELVLEHNVRGLPVSFVVGPDGEIVYRRIGEILPEEFDAWLADNL